MTPSSQHLESPAIPVRFKDYVRGLLRLYREVPDNVRTAWQNDRDGRLTFHKLNDLVRLKHHGDQAGVDALLQQLLSSPSRRRTAPNIVFKTGEEHLADSLKACGISQALDGTLTATVRFEEESTEKKSQRRRMSRKQIQRIKDRLLSISPAVLAQRSIGADALLRFALSLLGEKPRSDAWSVIDNVMESIDDTTGVPDGALYLQTAEFADSEADEGEEDICRRRQREVRRQAAL